MNFDRLRLLWVKISLGSQNLVIRTLQWILFRKAHDPARILIFRTGSIGDNICAFPALIAIRRHYAKSKVHLLTDAGAQNLVSLSRLLPVEFYDEVVDYSSLRPRDLLTLLRKSKYDLVIELPQNIVTLRLEIRNMLFFRMAGIRSGFGWHVTTCFSFLQTQERKLSFLSETDNLLTILNANGIPFPGKREFPLQLSKEDKAVVDAQLGKTIPDISGRKLVALVPGAKRSQNRYPFDRFVSLADWLLEKGYTIIVVGGPEDVERGNQLAQKNGIHTFCGMFTPSQSAILLSRCLIAISNDTGPMHLSYAIGTPVIGLFSSRDFQEKWFPPKGNIALRNYHVHCSMCFTETCTNNICMQGIPLESVKNSFLELEARLK